jgi:hypothetical protein
MGKLSYGMMMSLDGYLADASSYFEAEVLGFINDETRKIGTEIYGRRMYEEMVYWVSTPPVMGMMSWSFLSWFTFRVDRHRTAQPRPDAWTGQSRDQCDQALLGSQAKAEAKPHREAFPGGRQVQGKTRRSIRVWVRPHRGTLRRQSTGSISV